MEEIRTLRRSVRFSETSEQLRPDFDSLRIAATKGFYKVRKEMKKMRKDIDKRMDRFEEAMANIQRNFEERLATMQCDDFSTFDISTTLYAASSDNINDILPITATYTGTTSTITPSIPSRDNEMTSTIIYNYNNNSSNNISQDIVYEEESLTLNSIDETFLTTEDYEFVESIRSSTFSGLFYHYCFMIPQIIQQRQ